MKLQTLIIDDEQDARSLLKRHLANYHYIQIIGEIDNGTEAVEAINRARPDVIFLDMQMSGLNGLQVLEQLVHVPKIVFHTSFDSYALQAFERNAIDYLLKPYSDERLEKTMLKLLTTSMNNIDNVISIFKDIERSKRNKNRFLVELGGKMMGIQADEIVWLEAKGDYSLIHTMTKTHLSKYGISIIEVKLPTGIFIRIHRSKIININYIRETYKTTSGLAVLLGDNTHHKISRSYLENIKWLIL